MAKIKGTLLGEKKIYEKKERVIWFFEWWFDFINHDRIKFCVHKTFGIGNITFFVCHKTTYDHMINKSYDFVRGEKLEMKKWTFFICKVTICVMLQLRMKAPFDKSSPCQVQWPEALWKWICSIFYISYDLMCIRN